MFSRILSIIPRKEITLPWAFARYMSTATVTKEELVNSSVVGFFHALKQGEESTVQILLKNGFDPDGKPNVLDGHNQRPLSFMVENHGDNWLELLQILFQYGARVDLLSPEEQFALLCRLPIDSEWLSLFKGAGGNVNVTKDGEGILHRYLDSGYYAEPYKLGREEKVLLQSGARVDILSPEEQFALLCRLPIESGSFKAFKDAGGDINMINEGGEGVLHIAFSPKHPGGACNFEEEKQYSRKYDRESADDYIQEFVELGGDLNRSSAKQILPLYNLIADRNFAGVEAMLNNGADPTKVTDGKTILDHIILTMPLHSTLMLKIVLAHTQDSESPSEGGLKPVGDFAPAAIEE